MNPSTFSHNTSTDQTSSATYSHVSNPLWDQQPTQCNVSLDLEDPNLVTNLESFSMNPFSSSSHQEMLRLDPLTNSYPTHLSPNQPINNLSMSSIHNTPFNNPSELSNCVGLQMSPVTNRIETENNEQSDNFPMYVLPDSLVPPNEPSSSSFNPTSTLPPSIATSINNQQPTSSPVRQIRTPRSKRATPKPGTLSSAITRSRPLSCTRVTKRSVDDTILLSSPSPSLRAYNFPPIAPSSVPTPRRSNGPFATPNEFSIGPAWKPSRQLVEAHVQVKHASITAEIETWKQKMREDLKRQDLNKPEAPQKLASKREALISRKKSEKKNELLNQQLQFTIEENLVLKHQLDHLTDLFHRHKLENQ